MTTTTITLKKPIIYQNESITTITLREPIVRDRLALDHMGGTEGDKEIGFIANLSETPKEALMLLSLTDYGQIQKALADFLAL